MSDRDHPKLIGDQRTLYVGRVERSRTGGRIRLIAARSAEGFWIPELAGEFVKLPSLQHDYQNKQIVFLELSLKHEIVSLKEGDVEILKFLNHLAASVDRISEWRESLQYQGEEIRRRTEVLELREAEIELMLQSEQKS